MTCPAKEKTSDKETYALDAVVEPPDRDLEAALGQPAPGQAQKEDWRRTEQSWDYTYSFQRCKSKTSC